MDRRVDIENMGMDNQKITMTKKDYIIIANSINNARTALLYATVNAGETNRCVDYIINHLCMSLKRDNAMFDENKFAEACKPDVNTIERDCMSCEETFITTNEDNYEHCPRCRQYR